MCHLSLRSKSLVGCLSKQSAKHPATRAHRPMLLLRVRPVRAVRTHLPIKTLGFRGIMSTGNKQSAVDTGADAHQPHEIVLDRFCLRQFDDPKYSGAQIKFDKDEFVKKINEIYREHNRELVDGYAPFCKHLFVENFTDTRVNVVPITQSNSRLLQSDYEARVPHELPVLVRWFPSHSVTPKVAQYLDIILYSRDQIRKENAATGLGDDTEQDNAPWGIVSIKAQDVDYELPMNPITLMRNALGKEEGGSGVPLNRDEYLKSVEYWREHAIVK